MAFSLSLSSRSTPPTTTIAHPFQGNNYSCTITISERKSRGNSINNINYDHTTIHEGRNSGGSVVVVIILIALFQHQHQQGPKQQQ